MIFLLRFMLKLLFAPVSLVLALFVWFFTWLVCVSSVVLGLASAVLSLLALAILLLSASVEGFIIYLVLAFLASPFGSGCRRLPFGCWAGCKECGISFRKGSMVKP